MLQGFEELSLLEAQAFVHHRSYDLVDMFAGKANISKVCKAHGLNVCTMDIARDSKDAACQRCTYN